MKTVSIHDAKTNLSKYIAAAKQGEIIYIGSFGNQEVMLTKIPAKKRKFSKLRGMIKDTGDGFSADTEKEITDLLLGEK